MSTEVDYYDVQAMIRDARSEIRGEIDNAIRGLARELRDDLSDAVQTLDRRIDSLQRTLASRTDHLV